MLLYVPPSVQIGSDAPTLMWYVIRFLVACSNLIEAHITRIHGGSFVSGSATGPGLDGSILATNSDAIIAVVQYRLGAVSNLNISRFRVILIVSL